MPLSLPALISWKSSKAALLEQSAECGSDANTDSSDVPGKWAGLWALPALLFHSHGFSAPGCCLATAGQTCVLLPEILPVPSVVYFWINAFVREIIKTKCRNRTHVVVMVKIRSVLSRFETCNCEFLGSPGSFFLHTAAFWASAVPQLCRPWGKIPPDNFWSLWNGALSANSGQSPGSAELLRLKTTFICSVFAVTWNLRGWVVFPWLLWQGSTSWKAALNQSLSYLGCSCQMRG